MIKIVILLTFMLFFGEVNAEQGYGSFYSYEFAGRKTANGERFNPEALTAAHKSLRFGTYVRVTNLRNKKSVVVRINDRGPFVHGRVIDLSLAAAKVLNINGVALVSIELL
jgi:rare lipoprotein A